MSESQPNQEATSPDRKRQKTDSSDNGNETAAEISEKSTTNDPELEVKKPEAKIDFPEVILDYFTNPKIGEEERLGHPNSYYESNNEFKKLIFDFEKNLPFVIQREKLKNKERATLIQDIMNLVTDTVYFQASFLLLRSLKMENIKDPENTNSLNVFLREKNISEDEFYRHHYYYFLFSSQDHKKRFIATCPDDEEVTIEFPSESVLKKDYEKIDEIVETSLVVDEKAEFSSGEDDDIKSSPGSPQNSISRNMSPSSSPGRSKSREITPATAEIQTEISALPSSPNATVATNKINQSPTRSKSSLSKTVKKSTSHMLDFTPIRFLRSVISHSKNEQPSASASAMKNPEQPETITIMNTFQGKVLKKRGKSIQGNRYNAFDHPCTTELKPTYVKLNESTYSDKYFVGYLVDFGTPVSPLAVHLLTLGKTKLWFHVGHLLMDTETKDTYSMFNFAPYYEKVSQMHDILIYTDYTAEENTIGNINYYAEMYSEENQKKVFESFKNHEKYFNPAESLVLVQQELMDQKSVPVMTHKRAALDYMNIAPMYKIIKDTTWNKVENVVLKVPFVTNVSTVMFITGTYGSLKVNGSTEGVYLDKDGKFNGKQRIKVPSAFYKIMHIEYAPSRLGDVIPDHKKFFLNIVIVTHNDPFETNPKEICDTPIDCASIGWAKVAQKDPRFGFTYCCKWTRKFSEDLRIVPLYESLQPNKMEVLDLRTLWYIEFVQASHPLQPDELAIIEELKEAIAVYKDSILES